MSDEIVIDSCPICFEEMAGGPVFHLMRSHGKTVEEAMEIINRRFGGYRK